MTVQKAGLERAWAAWVTGQTDEAIRWCAALLESDSAQLGAASLLFAGLVRVEHSLEPELGLNLVDRLIAAGDLPRAVALASRLPSKSRAYTSVAKAFGRGSTRVADVAPSPPALPAKVSIDAQLAGAEGSALYALAAEALAASLAVGGSDPASKVPRYPLFGDLPPAALEGLLRAFECRVLKTSEPAIVEGEEGVEAFVVVRGHLHATRASADGEEVVLADLGPGALFGEMALVSDAPRAASVVAIESVEILAASRTKLEALAKKTPTIGEQLSAFCRARMVSNLIHHSAILGAVAADEREALMERFEVRRFKQEETLVEMGQETQGLFLIASGGVRIVGRDADGDSLQVAELGPGDIVGEISLVFRRPATADVVANHQTVALQLTRDEFQEAIREHPALLGELYELAAKRDEEMRSVVAQEALDVEGMVLL